MHKLNEIQNLSPFKVPENYFEDVNRKIISATSEEYNHEVKMIGLYSRFRTYFLIAASVTGIFILSYTTLKLLTPFTENSILSEVLYEEIPELYINDIDILTLEENVSSLIFSVSESQMNKPVIIDYLLLENIEIDEIYEKL